MDINDIESQFSNNLVDESTWTDAEQTLIDDEKNKAPKFRINEYRKDPIPYLTKKQKHLTHLIKKTKTVISELDKIPFASEEHASDKLRNKTKLSVYESDLEALEIKIEKKGSKKNNKEARNKKLEHFKKHSKVAKGVGIIGNILEGDIKGLYKMATEDKTIAWESKVEVLKSTIVAKANKWYTYKKKTINDKILKEIFKIANECVDLQNKINKERGLDKYNLKTLVKDINSKPLNDIIAKKFGEKALKTADDLTPPKEETPTKDAKDSTDKTPKEGVDEEIEKRVTGVETAVSDIEEHITDPQNDTNKTPVKSGSGVVDTQNVNDTINKLSNKLGIATEGDGDLSKAIKKDDIKSLVKNTTVMKDKLTYIAKKLGPKQDTSIDRVSKSGRKGRKGKGKRKGKKDEGLGLNLSIGGLAEGLVDGAQLLLRKKIFARQLSEASKKDFSKSRGFKKAVTSIAKKEAKKACRKCKGGKRRGAGGVDKDTDKDKDKGNNKNGQNNTSKDTNKPNKGLPKGKVALIALGTTMALSALGFEAGSILSEEQQASVDKWIADNEKTIKGAESAAITTMAASTLSTSKPELGDTQTSKGDKLKAEQELKAKELKAKAELEIQKQKKAIDAETDPKKKKALINTLKKTTQKFSKALSAFGPYGVAAAGLITTAFAVWDGAGDEATMRNLGIKNAKDITVADRAISTGAEGVSGALSLGPDIINGIGSLFGVDGNLLEAASAKQFVQAGSVIADAVGGALSGGYAGHAKMYAAPHKDAMAIKLYGLPIKGNSDFILEYCEKKGWIDWDRLGDSELLKTDGMTINEMISLHNVNDLSEGDDKKLKKAIDAKYVWVTEEINRIVAERNKAKKAAQTDSVSVVKEEGNVTSSSETKNELAQIKAARTAQIKNRKELQQERVNKALNTPVKEVTKPKKVVVKPKEVQNENASIESNTMESGTESSAVLPTTTKPKEVRKKTGLKISYNGVVVNDVSKQDYDEFNRLMDAGSNDPWNEDIDAAKIALLKKMKQEENASKPKKVKPKKVFTKPKKAKPVTTNIKPAANNTTQKPKGVRKKTGLKISYNGVVVNDVSKQDFDAFNKLMVEGSNDPWNEDIDEAKIALLKKMKSKETSKVSAPIKKAVAIRKKVNEKKKIRVEAVAKAETASTNTGTRAKTDISIRINNKTLKNVSQAESDQIDALREEQSKAMRAFDFDKSDEIDVKIDAIAQVILKDNLQSSQSSNALNVASLNGPTEETPTSTVSKVNTQTQVASNTSVTAPVATPKVTENTTVKESVQTNLASNQQPVKDSLTPTETAELIGHAINNSKEKERLSVLGSSASLKS